MVPVYNLQIITPQGILYSGAVQHTLVPVENGFVGVLANHAPYVSSSTGGRLVAREKDGKEITFQVGPGFFDVAANKAFFLTPSAEPQSSSISI